jgi:hypothetical protein
MIRLGDGFLGLKWRATADEEPIVSPYRYGAGTYQKTAIASEFMTANSLGIAIGKDSAGPVEREPSSRRRIHTGANGVISPVSRLG